MAVTEIRPTIYGPDSEHWTHEHLARLFGRRVIDGLQEGRSVAWLEYHARLAGSYARLTLEDREQAIRNHAHRDLVAQVFATLGPVLRARIQEDEDRALTEYLGGRQARLMEDS